MLDAQRFGVDEEPCLSVRHLSKRFGAGCPHCLAPAAQLERNVCPRCGTVHAVRDVSLDVFPAEIVGIVGESGCGKTTVAKLLTGALRPGSGRVLLDGKPVESLDRQAYYASLAHVSCETFLFHDTIRANFLLTNPHAAEEEMWRALALVRLDGLVQERGGLDFVLNEDAVDISGGQKQRLSIARLFLKNPQILILDEATSALDSVTEQRIQHALDTLARGRTCIIIAHRLSTVQGADRVAVIDGARVCEQGTPAELIARDGKYAALCRAQHLI